MILRTGSAFAISLSALLSAWSAQAQVIEISADGEAVWVTGQRAGSSVTSTASTSTAAIPATAAAIIPADSVADARRSASGIPDAYAAHVDDLARRYNLSPALLEALVWQESRWRHDAVSPAGARGLAQLMPGTARELGVDPDDPFANLEGGARYLRLQLNRFDGNLELALAAYNAGPARVAREGGIPRIRETENYVASIMRRLAHHSREAQ